MKKTLLFKRVVIILLLISAGYIGYVVRNGISSAPDVSLDYKKTNSDNGGTADMAMPMNSANTASANTASANTATANIAIANIATANIAIANIATANITSIDHADLLCWGVQQFGKGNTFSFCWEGYALGIWNHCWHGPDAGCWDGHDVACRYDGNERWQDCYGYYTGSKSWIQGALGPN